MGGSLRACRCLLDSCQLYGCFKDVTGSIRVLGEPFGLLQTGKGPNPVLTLGKGPPKDRNKPVSCLKTGGFIPFLDGNEGKWPFWGVVANGLAGRCGLEWPWGPVGPRPGGPGPSSRGAVWLPMAPGAGKPACQFSTRTGIQAPPPRNTQLGVYRSSASPSSMGGSLRA